MYYNKPVTHYNILSKLVDIAFQPEDSLFVSYISLILDQEDDDLFEEENMLLERNYTEVKPPR